MEGLYDLRNAKDPDHLEFLRDKLDEEPSLWVGPFAEQHDPYDRTPEQPPHSITLPPPHPSKYKMEYYCFTKCEDHRMKRIRRTRDGRGSWKSHGKKIIEKDSEIMGWKERLYFLEGQNGNRTKWVMIEYTLNTQYPKALESALCKIFEAERQPSLQVSGQAIPPASSGQPMDHTSLIRLIEDNHWRTIFNQASTYHYQ